jgi:hypothetical protein
MLSVAFSCFHNRSRSPENPATGQVPCSIDRMHKRRKDAYEDQGGSSLKKSAADDGVKIRDRGRTGHWAQPRGVRVL